MPRDTSANNRRSEKYKVESESVKVTDEVRRGESQAAANTDHVSGEYSVVGGVRISLVRARPRGPFTLATTSQSQTRCQAMIGECSRSLQAVVTSCSQHVVPDLAEWAEWDEVEEVEARLQELQLTVAAYRAQLHTDSRKSTAWHHAQLTSQMELARLLLNTPGKVMVAARKGAATHWYQCMKMMAELNEKTYAS